MRGSHALVVTLAGALVVARGSLVAADPAAADRAIAVAQALASHGDFVAAAAQFEIAYAADPRPELICNVGVAYHKAQDWPRAQLYLGRCLERGSVLDPAFMNTVRGVLAQVEATLRAGDFTPIDLSATPAGTQIGFAEFGAGETFSAPRVVWLPVGPHQLVATADGFAPLHLDLVARGHDVQPVAVTLHRPALVAPAGPPPPRGSSSRVPAIAATVVAVGLGAVAVVAHGRASDAAARAADALSPAAYAADQDTVTSWNRTFALTGVAAVIGATASGYLWYRAVHGARVEVAPTGRGAAVTLSGRF